MFPDFGRCGAIDDIGLGLRWEAGTLAVEVARRAATLAQCRIGPGSVVAISHSGSALFFADLFAVWTIGAVAACLDSGLTDLELQTVMGFAEPAALLVNKPTASNTHAVPILELSSSPLGPSSTVSKEITHFDPDRPALILFTSGTTGSPKGVVLTYRALQTRIDLNVEAIGAAALKRTLVTLPTHFGHGLIGNALTALLTGGDIVLYPPGTPLGDRLGRIIDKHSISFITSVPALWNLVMRASPPPAGDSLVRVHVGSAPLSAKLWLEIAAWSRAEVVNCYGMTETANWFAGASSRVEGIADGLVGKTWGGVAAVMDDRGAIQRTGEGEIIIQSPCLMSGYLNRPDLTAEVTTNGWFRTGDRGTIDDLGRIWLIGRIKEEINCAGFKVQPAEIDFTLEAHPAVAEACAFAIADPLSGEVVGAAIRLSKDATIDTDILKVWCRERIRSYAVPERWFVVASIPRNARGKVNRDAVRRQLETTDTVKSNVEAAQTCNIAVSTDRGDRADPIDSPPDVSTANRLRAAVERAWTSVLDRRSFLANMQWDLAGGDSLRAMHLWLHIEQQLGMQLPIDRLELNMTPRELTGAIDKLLKPGERSVIDHPRQQHQLIFFMPPAHGDSPLLAQFRAALDGRVRFDVIRYPGSNALIDGGGEFNVIVNAAVAQILAKGGGGACYLAGYSFGGFVAWETARLLIRSGRQIGFLGLIDPQFTVSPREGSSILRDFLRWLFELFVRNCPLSLLRQTDRIVSLLGSAALPFQLRLVERLRSNALQRNTIEPLDIPATLFRSDECCAEARDYGWGKLCRQLVVLPIPGRHRSLFEPEFRRTLCTRFLQAVEAARGRAD
jgi:acyl-CoA synthetase (AMP-forming)/AMP-acid ligase II/thioesterase domain-containing protein